MMLARAVFRRSYGLLAAARNNCAGRKQTLPPLQVQQSCSTGSRNDSTGGSSRGMVTRSAATDRETALTAHEANNVSPAIAERIGRNLHRREHHPLNNIKHVIETHFNEVWRDHKQRYHCREWG